MTLPPHIPWTPALETGHPEIDSQHRTLVQAINRLHAAAAEGRGQAELESCLSYLKAYARVHFRTEEQLFADIPGIDLAEHVQTHARLLGVVDDLFRRHLAGEPEILDRTLSVLHGWILDHIQNEDREAVQKLPKRS